jgi:hypothetical protein
MKHRFVSPALALSLGLGSVVLFGALALAPPALADIDVHVDIGGAPPPPAIVFHARPHQVFDRGSSVYVVDDPGVGDNDCFRYGGYYWVFRDGYWYRSANWRGGFVVVQPRVVPTAIYRVQPTRWKHHASGPPGLMKKPGHMPPGQEKKHGGRGY